MRGQTFKQGAQAAVPTALGYIGIGLACGIMAAPYMNPLEMGLFFSSISDIFCSVCMHQLFFVSLA